MPTFEATVDDRQAVTLPKELCERLGIKPGSRVEFFLTLDGQVHFHALTADASGFGRERRVPPVSIREMDDGIEDYLSEKHRPKHPRGASKSLPAAE
jgi:AbrB family looped-hinge helix DNA binding protein